MVAVPSGRLVTFMAFQVAPGNEQRMRADVSELVYRARAVSIVDRTLPIPCLARRGLDKILLLQCARCDGLGHAAIQECGRFRWTCALSRTGRAGRSSSASENPLTHFSLLVLLGGFR